MPEKSLYSLTSSVSLHYSVAREHGVLRLASQYQTPEGRSQDTLGGTVALTNTQGLTDWQIALNTVELDAIIVATPAETHYPVIRAALIKGLHVLAEKPLTLTVAESIELCELAQKNNVQLVVDHTYLFNPAVARSKT